MIWAQPRTVRCINLRMLSTEGLHLHEDLWQGFRRQRCIKAWWPCLILSVYSEGNGGFKSSAGVRDFQQFIRRREDREASHASYVLITKLQKSKSLAWQEKSTISLCFKFWKQAPGVQVDILLWEDFRVSLKITQDWTVEKEASGGDEDMLRFLQVESLESLKFKWFPRCEAFALTLSTLVPPRCSVWTESRCQVALLDSMRLPVAQTIPVRIRLKDPIFFHVFAVIRFDEVTRYLDIVVTARCKIVVLKWKQSQIFKALLSPFSSRKRRAQARQDWKKLLHRLPYAYDACAYHHIFPQFARLVALRQIRAGEEITVSPGQTHEPCCHAPFITLIVCSLSSAKVLLIWTWSSRGWLGSKEWPCLAIEQRKLSVLSFVGAGNFCRQTGTFNANVWGDGRSLQKRKTTKRILRIDNIRCSAPDDRRCTLCPACITAGDLLFEAGKAVCSMMSQHWRDSKVHVSCILILVIAYQKLNIHSLQAALLAL